MTLLFYALIYMTAFGVMSSTRHIPTMVVAGLVCVAAAWGAGGEMAAMMNVETLE